MTWLGIVVAGILLLTAYKGFRRGFIREIVSFFFVFLALAVSWAINPYVNEFFMENTPRKAVRALWNLRKNRN